LSAGKKKFPLRGRFFSALLIVLIGISYYCILTHLTAFRAWLSGVLTVLNPFMFGIIIAYLLNSPTVFFERKLFPNNRHKRGLAMILSYLCATAFVAVLVILILPQAIQSILHLWDNLESYLSGFYYHVMKLVEYLQIDSSLLDSFAINYQDIITKIANFIATRIPAILNYGMALGKLLIAAITAFISSIYMLFGKEQLLRQGRKVIYAIFSPERARWVLSVCSHANYTFSGFIIGKIIDSAIIGVLCFLLCTLFKIPMAVLVGVVVGFTNIIPFFGPFIGAIPCIMILLLVDPWSAIRFSVLILALQQFDGNILGPYILGDKTGLSSIWVLISIVVAGGLFGFAGMLLGVPTFAVIFALVREWVNTKVEEKNIPFDDLYPADTPTNKKE